jgi:hypothetical protein
MTNRKLGDRRSRPRFEIVGQLWGALETVEPLDLKDISRGGALLESRVPLSPDSVHRLRVAFNDVIADVQARVRHVRSVPRASGDRYLIGLEFLHVQQAALDRIDQMVARAGEVVPPQPNHVAEA